MVSTNRFLVVINFNSNKTVKIKLENLTYIRSAPGCAKSYDCMYICDINNLAVKESRPARTRSMSISFGGRVGAEEPVGLFDNECVCTLVL